MVIGGLISSTALTLILVPVLYELVGRGAARVARVGRREDEKSGPERRDEAAEQPA
ncbi:hypothetical protein [Serinicoccus marinus]|uniref:hypothetical protein n=1 Tax=Serinicoccus marinus TaxID=247333 RepID=UPI0023AE817F|nr:hypothetical protein [Serinicoccus marinus]